MLSAGGSAASSLDAASIGDKPSQTIHVFVVYDPRLISAEWTGPASPPVESPAARPSAVVRGRGPAGIRRILLKGRSFLSCSFVFFVHDLCFLGERQIVGIYTYRSF